MPMRVIADLEVIGLCSLSQYDNFTLRFWTSSNEFLSVRNVTRTGEFFPFAIIRVGGRWT